MLVFLLFIENIIVLLRQKWRGKASSPMWSASKLDIMWFENVNNIQASLWNIVNKANLHTPYLYRSDNLSTRNSEAPYWTPLDPHYYPLTQAAPQNEHVKIIRSVNKRSTLQLTSSFILKTLNFEHVKRPSLLSGFDAWTLYQKANKLITSLVNEMKCYLTKVSPG